MLKFTKINESKKFYPDPSIIKKYALFIIPLFISGDIKCQENLIDEWLEMNLKRNKDVNINQISDLEILAVKQVLDDPTTQNGWNQLMNEIKNKSPKLERFLRSYYIEEKTFL
jgi:hypothetical protein